MQCRHPSLYDTHYIYTTYIIGRGVCVTQVWVPAIEAPVEEALSEGGLSLSLTDENGGSLADLSSIGRPCASMPSPAEEMSALLAHGAAVTPPVAEEVGSLSSSDLPPSLYDTPAHIYIVYLTRTGELLYTHTLSVRHAIYTVCILQGRGILQETAAPALVALPKLALPLTSLSAGQGVHYNVDNGAEVRTPLPSL